MGVFRKQRGVGLALGCWIAALCVESSAIPPGMTVEQIESMSGPPDVTAGGGFNSLNVQFLSQLNPRSFSTNAACTGVCANDVWGYVSPTGREYAIIGLRTGTGFVDVTDPYNPFIVASILDATSIWSDMKTYGHYAYNVNESGGGMQIFDLSNIDPPTRQVTLIGALTQSGLQRSHTMYINEESGFAYLAGSNLSGGRLLAVSLANPAAPVISGQALDPFYVHAAQVVSYHTGPFAGREIAFCYDGAQGLHILDVTVKSNMYLRSSVSYPTVSYSHQGEITDDRRFVLIDDELDEDDGFVATTTTYVVNVEDLDNPFYVSSFTNGQPSIDHNQMIRGNHTYQANYTTGLRVYDISSLPAATEVGFLDTYPPNNSRNFDGAWGVYAKLPSGTVLVSDIQGGLFALDVTEAVGPDCPTPQPTIPVAATSRYLSITPMNTGRPTALRVRVVDMPPPFEGLEGTVLWVDRPTPLLDPVFPQVTYQRAALRCTPMYVDWSDFGTIHLIGSAIVPGGVYEIQAIDALCARSVEANYSPTLIVAPSLPWADSVGPSGNVPDGVTDARDVVGVVNKFKQLPGSPSIPQTDLYGSTPDGVVNALDISLTVDAFKGLAYPFSPPAPCP